MPLEKKRVINIETGTSQRNVQTLKQQIKELRDSMGMMEKGTEEWEKASVKLSSALQKQREIAEAGSFTNQDYGNKLANISKVGAGVTAGINGLTNALSLMGIQMGKDDTAMIKFTTSMMAVVQGLASLDTANKAWKGLVVGMNAALDARLKDTASTAANTVSVKANTAAKTENTAATTANATATGGATVATNGLSAAFTKMAAVAGISKAALGGITAAVGVLVVAVGVLVSQWKKAREEQRKMDEEFEKAAEAAAKVKAKTDLLVYDFDRLASSFRTAKEEGRDLTEWVKTHRSELDKLGITTDDFNNIENVFINKTEEYKKALAERYKAEAQMIAYREQLVEQYRILNQMQDIKTDGSGKQYYMLDGKKVYTGGAKTAFERDQQNKVIDAILEKMGGVQTTLDDSNRTLRNLGTTNQSIAKSLSDQNRQANAMAERENIERIINESKVISTEIRKVMEQFIAGKSGDELDNFLYNLNSLTNGDQKVNRLLSDTMKKLLGNYRSGSDYRGNYAKQMQNLNTVLKKFNQTMYTTDGNVKELMDDIAKLMTTVGSEAENIISGDWLLGRSGIFNREQYEKDIKELYNVENKIEQINARDRNAKLEREQKINKLIAERVGLEKEISKENERQLDKTEYEQEALNKIREIDQEIELKNTQFKRWLNSFLLSKKERDKYNQYLDDINFFQKLGNYYGIIGKNNPYFGLYGEKLDEKYEADIAELEKKKEYYVKLFNGLNVDNRKYLTDQIKKLNEQIEELQNLPEVKSVELPGLTAKRNELEENLKYYKEIIRLQEEAESKGVENIMMFRDSLGSMQVDVMEMLGADQKDIYDAQIEFEKETVKLLEKYRDNASRTDEERVNTELKIWDLNKKINELAKARQELAYKEGAERLANLQAELRQRYDRTVGDMDVYNKGWARLGSSDWNDPTARLDAERVMLQARFDLAEQYRQQNLISEKEYLDQLKQYQADMHSWQIDMMTAAAQRRLDILNTSFDAVRSIVSSVNGLLGEAMAGEEQNSTKYKQLRIAQTIASGSVASIEALRSGIQSPIPAPGNYALGLGLMGSTIAQTVMAVGNIRNETLNGNSSAGLTNGALNIGGNVYETLAYETNSEISSNIRDSRVYVVESDINQTGNRVYVAESEATW